MYDVKILSDTEFDALPFPEVELSLGVADPKTNTAYIRYTGLPEVDSYLINHEIEHLIEGAGGEHSDHFRHGVYYKNPLNFIAPAAALIPGIGPIISPMLGMAGQAMDARQAKKKANSMANSNSPFESMPQVSQGSPLNSFSPHTSSAPNVVKPGGGSGFQAPAGGGAIGGAMGGGTPIDRVKGFFTSRNPLENLQAH